MDEPEVILYIGLTNNISHRFSAHRCNNTINIPYHKYDLEILMVCDTKKDGLYYERLFIEEHKPKYNRQYLIEYKCMGGNYFTHKKPQ
jgi:excinuclease UvrABC nuclease subunit